MSITRDQWREYHYGKPVKKPTVTRWKLVYLDEVLQRGNYALCKWKKNQLINSGNFNSAQASNLLIKPDE
jgi:hypothetical protein